MNTAIITRLEAAIDTLGECMRDTALSDDQRKHAAAAVVAISDVLTIPRYAILPKRLRTEGVY